MILSSDEAMEIVMIKYILTANMAARKIKARLFFRVFMA